MSKKQSASTRRKQVEGMAKYETWLDRAVEAAKTEPRPAMRLRSRPRESTPTELARRAVVRHLKNLQALASDAFELLNAAGAEADFEALAAYLGEIEGPLAERIGETAGALGFAAVELTVEGAT